MRDVLLGLGVGGLLVPVAYLLTGVVQHLFPKLTPQEHLLVPVFTSSAGLGARVFLIVAACAIIPAVEEMLFRGLLFGALRPAFGPGWAALVSAVLFAGAHQSLSSFLSLALVGLVFAWLYERTGSLITSTVAHGVFNAFGIAWMMLIYR